MEFVLERYMGAIFSELLHARLVFFFPFSVSLAWKWNIIVPIKNLAHFSRVTVMSKSQKSADNLPHT